MNTGIKSSLLMLIQILLYYQSLVLDALKNVEGDRKCFRLIGGVLVERTVKEVSPSLQKNKDAVSYLMSSALRGLIDFIL